MVTLGSAANQRGPRIGQQRPEAAAHVRAMANQTTIATRIQTGDQPVEAPEHCAGASKPPRRPAHPTRGAPGAAASPAAVATVASAMAAIAASITRRTSAAPERRLIIAGRLHITSSSWPWSSASGGGVLFSWIVAHRAHTGLQGHPAERCSHRPGAQPAIISRISSLRARWTGCAPSPRRCPAPGRSRRTTSLARSAARPRCAGCASAWSMPAPVPAAPRDHRQRGNQRVHGLAAVDGDSHRPGLRRRRSQCCARFGTASWTAGAAGRRRPGCGTP